MSITHLRQCTKCQGIKPLSEFYQNMSYADGYSTQCKSCLRTHNKIYLYVCKQCGGIKRSKSGRCRTCWTLSFHLEPHDIRLFIGWKDYLAAFGLRKCALCWRTLPKSQFSITSPKVGSQKPICNQCWPKTASREQKTPCAICGTLKSPRSDNCVGCEPFVRAGMTEDQVLTYRLEADYLESIGKRQCTRCLKYKFVSDFWHKSKKGSDRSRVCKECQAVPNQDKCPVCNAVKSKISQYCRRCRTLLGQGHTEEQIHSLAVENRSLRQVGQQRCATCGEVLSQKYFKNHSPHCIICQDDLRIATAGVTKRGRRALVMGSEPRLTSNEWVMVLDFWGHHCAYADCDGPLVMDHVQPLSKGGTHDVFNVVPACANHNISKGAKDVRAWMYEKGLDYETFILRHQGFCNKIGKSKTFS